MPKYETVHAAPLAKLERRRSRPASLSVDVILMTIVFFGLAYLVVFCFRRELVELGVALVATLVWFCYRVIAWDQNRLIEDTSREYQSLTPPPRKLKPVTIETNGTSYTIRYGQLDATQEEYNSFLQAVSSHPRRRLTIRAIPRSMLPDRDKRYKGFCKELRRLGWLDRDNMVTDLGFEALTALAAGDDSPTGQ